MIRAARADDIPAIAQIHVRSWRWAYSDYIDVASMKTVEEREALWRELGVTRTWVWDQDGRVAAFVTIGEKCSGEQVAGELRALYVDPPAQGAGVGDALLSHAVDELRSTGFKRATLWVLADNGLARHFYEQRGWRPDGEMGERLGARTLRYARAL